MYPSDCQWSGVISNRLWKTLLLITISMMCIQAHVCSCSCQPQSRAFGSLREGEITKCFLSYTVYCRQHKFPLLSCSLHHSVSLCCFLPSVLSLHFFKLSPILPSTHLSHLSINTTQSFLNTAKSSSVSSYPLLCMCVCCWWAFLSLLYLQSLKNSFCPLKLWHCLAQGFIIEALISPLR